MRNDLLRSPALTTTRPRRLSLADVQAFTSPARQSGHARRRAAQRNLTAATEYILTWGRLLNRTGVLFYFLGRRDIPAQHRHLPQIARLAGSVALVSPGGEVITLYRNAHSLRDIQRKMKYRFTPGYPDIVSAEAQEEDESDAPDAADGFVLARGA